MLSFEIKGVSFNKTNHRNILMTKLSHRSGGAIEFKHQNISAILIKYGRPYIIGYKPRSNYQKSLEIAVLKYLENGPGIERDFELFTQNALANSFEKINFDNWEEPAPISIFIDEPPVDYLPRFSKVNYIEKEQNNQILGLLGEKLVVNYERWRLLSHGKDSLSEKIEWVSKDLGDGAGFDILSKNIDGTDRFIEVKTTKLGKMTPIYLTGNELRFSQKNERNYYLYRVFEFSKKPKMFNAQGRLDLTCKVEPISYIGKF